MIDHAAQRAAERLGINLTPPDCLQILSGIDSGALQPAAPADGNRAWFHETLMGIPAWLLYDYSVRRIITVLGERPRGIPGTLPTLYALADEYGLTHAEGKRIAGRIFDHLRHAHKSQTLQGCQLAKLRPLFAEAKEKAMKEVSTHPVIPSDGMTIREVADSLGVSRDLIEKRVRELFPDRMKQGETTFLSETEVTAVKLRIQQNSSLATSDDRRRLADMPKTALEKQLLIRQAMTLQDEIIAELQGQLAAKDEALAIAAPKVESFDRFLDASGTICIQDAAKQLGRGPLKIFEELEAKHLIFRRAGDWLPAQTYLDRGWFEVKTRTYGDPPNERITRQTRVTPKGLDALAKLFPVEVEA